jgi:hypothetical protein
VQDGIRRRKQRSLFCMWLDDLFPKLKNVALRVPIEIEDAELSNESIPIDICDLLKTGRLDVVRFYYTSVAEARHTD